MMRMNKKAALDLSINAIVVLILAITMLGLGLGFMYKMFGGTADKLDKMTGQLDSQMKDQLKESGKRLTLETNTLEMKKSSKKTIAFGIKNVQAEGLFQFGNGVTGAIDSTGESSVASAGCYQSFKSPNGEGLDTKIVITTPGNIKLKADEIKVMGVQVEATSQADSDTYQCSMIVYSDEGEYAREDFEVIVK